MKSDVRIPYFVLLFAFACFFQRVMLNRILFKATTQNLKNIIR